MKYRYFSLLIISMGVLLLAGCGGGSGAPGSSGSADTGIIIQSANVAVTSPDIDDSSSTDADISAGNPCLSSSLSRTQATLNVAASALNPNTASDPFPATVKECTITYKKADENPGAPIIQEFTQYPDCELVDGTNSCNLTLMDIQRKTDFCNAIAGMTNSPSTEPVHYVAVVNCSYQNAFGESGTFQSELDIWLANFVNSGG